METKTLTSLLADLARLQEAQVLLESVFHEYGPYRDGEIHQMTWIKVRDFFGFDDSE